MQTTHNLIEKTTAYKVGNICFPSIEEAQLAALENIFTPVQFQGSADAPVPSKQIAGIILDHSETILGILSMSDSIQKPRKPRADKGKSRKQETPAIPDISRGVTVEASSKYKGK